MSANLELENTKKVIDDYIVYAIQKYGSIEEVIQRLINYCYGNTNIITRDNDFRNRFINVVSKEKIAKITSNDISSYVINILNNFNKKIDEFNEKYNLFYNISYQIFTSFGMEYLKKSLMEATRGNNLDFNESIEPSEITKFCGYYLKARGYDLSKPMDIIDTYVLDISSYILSARKSY